jgi:anti-sigma B factor antagonist
VNTPRHFEIRADHDGVLWLSGELDLEQMDMFGAIATASLNGQRQVILELSGLTFLDSSGIRAILRFADLVPEGIILRNPSDNVSKVLEIAGVGDLADVRLEGGSTN